MHLCAQGIHIAGVRNHAAIGTSDSPFRRGDIQCPFIKRLSPLYFAALCNNPLIHDGFGGVKQLFELLGERIARILRPFHQPLARLCIGESGGYPVCPLLLIERSILVGVQSVKDARSIHTTEFVHNVF